MADRGRGPRGGRALTTPTLFDRSRGRARFAVETVGRDRLSALSDDLLHRILGSLDARLAVGQCSLLSRRWRHVWASMPRVTLPGLVSESFGSSLLLLREDATLRALSLHGSNDATHFAHQRRWLRHVASRGIRVLEITLVTAHPFDLPDCVFNCATLEEMAVSQSTIPSAVRDVVAPKSVCLPRLKKLRIHHMQLSDPEKLTSGCPALEELDLSRCSLGRVFRISSDTVKTLSVTACDYSEIHVSAPNVVSLKLSVTGRVVKLDAMPSLLRASVNVSGDGVVNQHATGRLGFLDALCNAQYLELSRFGLLLKDKMDMLMDEPAIDFCLFLPVNDTMMDEPATGGGPTFTKLKSLYLGEWLVADFYRPLAYFFKRAPGLAILSLDQWKLYEENNGMISGQVYKRDKPAEELNLSSDLEVLRLRISKGDDAGEYSTLRRILKEKTKPRETEVVWF